MELPNITKLIQLKNELDHLNKNIDEWESSSIELDSLDHVHILLDVDPNQNILAKLLQVKETNFMFCTSGKFAKDVITLLVADMNRKRSALEQQIFHYEKLLND